MPQETATILYNTRISGTYCKIGLTCAPQYANAAAGQFVTLKISGRMDPLLRRPFSIHRRIKEGNQVVGLEILYRVVGGFTGQLAEMVKNENIDLLGPLGRGFTISPDCKKPALIAGGIGVAPIVCLAESLDENGIDLSAAPVFLGGRTKTDILCETDFGQLGMRRHITTEDGSYGQKGLVTEPVTGWLKTHKPDIIYACGPHGLLQAISGIAREHGIPCEISIETVMACGLGVCMGCAVKTRDSGEGYRHVCKDGPVFDAARVLF